MAKKKNKAGRPSKFDDPAELATQILEYIDSCAEKRQMPNKAGLCIWLTVTRETYNEYKKKAGFSDALKGAEMWIENAWVQRLGGPNATGAIFYLKNAFSADYRDKHEQDITMRVPRAPKSFRMAAISQEHPANHKRGE